jgi:hypothetical protein
MIDEKELREIVALASKEVGDAIAARIMEKLAGDLADLKVRVDILEQKIAAALNLLEEIRQSIHYEGDE